MSPAMLFIFSGLPGSGKSTLAQALAKQRDAVYLRIDTIEQALRDLCAIEVEGEGYRLAYRIASDNLRLGRSVVADSCNPIELTRREWEEVARAAGADFANIEVICSDAAEHRRRVETRASEVPGLRLPTWSEVAKRAYHAWTIDRIVIDTAGRSEAESARELLSDLSVGAADRLSSPLDGRPRPGARRAMGGRADSGPCPDCGVENAADHNYCKHCGTALGLDEGGELKPSFAERMRDRCLELLKGQPDNPRPHFDLGLAYYHLGQTGNATRAFERCLQLEDAYPAAHFQLAMCHYRRGAMAECAALARQAIELNPMSAPAHFRLAIALFHQGRLDDSARAFERTVEVDPEYVIALYHLGLIRERQKAVEDAIKCFERVVESNPGDASAHYHLGLCYERSGLDGLAITELSRALELDPSDTAAASALQELQR